MTNTQNVPQVFDFDGRQVRIVEKNGSPWWVLKDVCLVLEVNNSRDITTRLDDDEKGVDIIDTLGGKQELTIISESGLYNVILLSRKPEAKRFKRWIIHEVLPSIRKHGGYLTDTKIEEILTNPDTIINLAQILKREQARVRELAAQVEE